MTDAEIVELALRRAAHIQFWPDKPMFKAAFTLVADEIAKLLKEHRGKETDQAAAR